MSRLEKFGVIFVGLVISLEVIRHYTWKSTVDTGPKQKPFVPIGMDFRTTVDRRA